MKFWLGFITGILSVIGLGVGTLFVMSHIVKIRKINIEEVTNNADEVE